VPIKRCRVEERRDGVQGRRRQSRATSFVAALAEKPITRFRSPLIEPDVTISVIQLSDGFHMRACATETGKR
jgi:hypothetical protein